MSITVSFSKTLSTKAKALVLPLTVETLEKSITEIERALSLFVVYALAQNPSFKAENGDILTLTPPENTGFAKIFLLGLGKTKDFNVLKAEKAAGKLTPFLTKSGHKSITLMVSAEQNIGDVKSHILAAHLANGIRLRAYNFDRYKSKKDDKDKGPKFEKLSIIHPHDANAKAAYEILANVTDGVFMARDLVNMPPNDLYPDSYAKLIRDQLKPLGIDVEILDEKKMQKLKMGAILAVGKGSEHQPRMVIMRWNGAKGKKSSAAKPLGFVGKGVTFDTGGISIKPGAGMDEMKMDMGGSACVVGLMKTLAIRKANIDVVGVVGLAENMPSAGAYRPGDILTSYSGKTIEVLNTDAEGRLVLADCLTYIQEKFDPRFIVDLATLTGAMMVALGHEYCGTFANDDKLWVQMEAASKASGEKLWRMPLDEVWTKEVESEVADIQNLGKSRYGGACTAAAFLGHFIDKDRLWAHMDIAGTAWRKSDQPTVPKFGSGFGVSVLNELISKNYE